MKTAGVIVPDVEQLVDDAFAGTGAEVSSTGCGSTEYVFDSKTKRNEAVRKLRKAFDAALLKFEVDEEKES